MTLSSQFTFTFRVDLRVNLRVDLHLYFIFDPGIFLFLTSTFGLDRYFGLAFLVILTFTYSVAWTNFALSLDLHRDLDFYLHHDLDRDLGFDRDRDLDLHRDLDVCLHHDLDFDLDFDFDFDLDLDRDLDLDIGTLFQLGKTDKGGFAVQDSSEGRQPCRVR